MSTDEIPTYVAGPDPHQAPDIQPQNPPEPRPTPTQEPPPTINLPPLPAEDASPRRRTEGNGMLGLSSHKLQELGLQEDMLADPSQLLGMAWATGPNNPERAQALLAAGLLGFSRLVADGRHGGCLASLAWLIARSDPLKTIGPRGAETRFQAMPNGYAGMVTSFENLRYAWLNGLPDLLVHDRSNFHTINELVRPTAQPRGGQAAGGALQKVVIATTLWGGWKMLKEIFG